MMVSSAQYDAASQIITEEGEFSCPMTGEKDKPFRATWKMQDKDKIVYEMYFKDPSGKEFKGMEITYSRRK
jgi:hypothetical protein